MLPQVEDRHYLISAVALLAVHQYENYSIDSLYSFFLILLKQYTFGELTLELWLLFSVSPNTDYEEGTCLLAI